jgi:hypothetical protein
MHRPLAAVALIVAMVAPALSAVADVTARIVATDPAGSEITLARNESLYILVEYATDQPVSIWTRPYFRGKAVDAMSNASIPHAGKGEALGWFAFNGPAEVDEIRVLAGDGSRAGTREVSSYPLKVLGTDAPATRRSRPAWVNDLSRWEEAVRREAFEKRMSEPISAGESAAMSAFMLTVMALLAAGFVWPAWAMWKWQGRWRTAAAIPIVVMGFVVLRIVFDTTRDPTSHNLWPFEIVMWGGASLAFMLALGFARRFVNVGG